jgi:hypothetical protein
LESGQIHSEIYQLDYLSIDLPAQQKSNLLVNYMDLKTAYSIYGQAGV